MRKIRRTIATVGVTAALGLGAVGCGTDNGNGGVGYVGGAAATTEAADASATLAAAATKLGETSLKVRADLGDNGTMTGAMDPPNKRGTMSMRIAAEGFEMSVDTRVIGTDMYMKMDMGGAALPGMDPDSWMRLDTSKLPENNSFGIKPGEFDPVGAAKFLRAVTTAERVDDRRITGTMDLTRAAGAAGVEDQDLRAMGAKAKAMPFEATVDAQGRLAELVLEMPAMAGQPAQKISVTYSDFGSPVKVSKPTGRIKEAPEAVYGQFAA